MEKAKHKKNRFSTLSAAKRALLEKRLQGAIKPDFAAGLIPRRSPKELPPLSFAQERLWILAQLEPDSAAYNRPVVLRLSGALNVTALEQGLSEILRRHDVLRATFSAKDGRPVQVITSAQPVSLSVVDLSKFSANERKVKAKRLAVDEARRPFDLTRGPLLRATLSRLNKEDHLLIVVIHHIAFDGWSAHILVNELAALYEAFTLGASPSLAELPIQYADFAHWQREQMQGEVLESRLAYWQQKLKDAPPSLDLPTDHFRPAIQSYPGAQQSLKLPADLVNSLKTLSQRQRVTLFMTLLAAFKILLYRYTGQHDIVVGTPTAGRSHIETEGLIGFFINPLVLRTDLSGNPTFRELLGRIREVALGAYAHQDLPFEKLVEQLRPERDLSRPPVFQVMFNLENIPQKVIRTHGLSIEEVEFDSGIALYDLNLEIINKQGTLTCLLKYNTELFTLQRMVALLDQYIHVLGKIVATPDNFIHAYSLVTPNTSSLLPDPSEELPEPRYDLVNKMFASWVKRTPHQPAVSQGSRNWSYKELAQSAQSLAKVLLAQGVQPGDAVAVCGPRSYGLIASMLGVLLSRAVLLTLDQNLPGHRQQIMLNEAQAKNGLYVGTLRPEDTWMGEALDVIHVDSETSKTMGLASQVPFEKIDLPEVDKEDAAYIFFTSGTTGIPKAVLGNHRGLAHFLAWQRQTFAVGPKDRSAQLTGLSFDVVLRDVFLPLTSGATLCLPPADYDLRASQILPWLEREKISLLHTVPSLAQSWLADEPPPVSLSALRWVFFAGETLTKTLVDAWRDKFTEAGEIVNLYGPTETTMVKCYYPLPADILPGVQPIGSPLPETQALILTKNMQHCGVGEVGEIVIRTPFRSLGYLNTIKENEQRFVNNPFRDDANDLLFLTGDLGRYRPDGSLEILGRLDEQVKIRGVRIEPGEVSAILGEHPSVQQTLVIAREDIAGEKRLVAYVIPFREQAPTASTLNRYLKQRLPESMLPSAFIFLDNLPLTPNGKVDRRALPAPDKTRPELEVSFVPPRTPIEEVLAGIWSDLLGIERIGINDNFFEMGGHSLLAMRIVSRIRDEFQVKLPLRTIFRKPALSEQALVIEDMVISEIEAMSEDDIESLFK